ncbi:MAG: hypothetical protein ABSG37_06055 [Candidatus Limnocylindrales bacterium]|jgi:hypothetical protein
MEPKRRVVAVLAGVAVVMIGIGIAALVLDSGFVAGGGATAGGSGTSSSPPGSHSAGPSQTPVRSTPSVAVRPTSPAPSASASPSSSAGPTTGAAGFVQEGDGFVYNAADGSTIPVTLLPGLEVRIQQGKATYWALASNKYGLKAGSYAGQFMPLVTMGQADGSSAETGGIVLTGPVVSKLISDKLASIPSAADRWIVALPVDIRSEADSLVDVSFDEFGLAGWSNTPRVVVRFSGSLPIVDAIPSNGGFHVLVEQLGLTAWQVIDPTRLGLPADAIDPAHAMNQLLVYGDGTPSFDGATLQRDIVVDGRVALGTPMLVAGGDVSVSLVVAGSRAELGPDKVLSVGDVPVFVASNS